MQHIPTNCGEIKMFINFKSSNNKNNRLSVAKRIVNSLQESVCNGNANDVMIKIHGLYVYNIVSYFKRIKWILLKKRSGS